VDYTLPDNGIPAAVYPHGGRPSFGATDSGTEILITVGNVPAGVTLAFPGSVPGPVINPATGVSGDHLVLDPSNTGVITGPVTSATVLYDYTCFSAQVCDTNFESFAIAPLVSSTNESAIGVITAQAQVVPLDTIIPGGVPSASTPPSSGPTPPRPRWSDPLVPVPDVFITLAPCSTTLLFPWVANAFGFDTGLAVNNTSQDYTNAAGLTGTPWLIAAPNYPTVSPTPPEQGTCTLYFFPENEAPVIYYTTPVVSTGATWTSMLSATPFAGNLGYMIARCNFQYGHGFAAIGEKSGAAESFAQSYLALLIPDPVVVSIECPICVPSRLATADASNFTAGESLDH